ncbi:hypothetical protein DID88_006207 [Monilinia fructigena]|uniref:Uncharacterized protein n=1 Tax=Monilinia fructigena TaxID=38457 RepID=A0A395J1Z2_9HELO|nr:hypothetical protein DID88_006207 [Monilinia fructigena]
MEGDEYDIPSVAGWRTWTWIQIITLHTQTNICQRVLHWSIISYVTRNLLHLGSPFHSSRRIPPRLTSPHKIQINSLIPL